MSVRSKGAVLRSCSQAAEKQDFEFLSDGPLKE
jgi:hypothetical protein